MKRMIPLIWWLGIWASVFANDDKKEIDEFYSAAAFNYQC